MVLDLNLVVVGGCVEVARSPVPVQVGGCGQLHLTTFSLDTVDGDITSSTVRWHHPATRHHPTLPFFPMTPLHFNHLLISLVVREKASWAEFKLHRSEDRIVTCSYETEYGIHGFHPCSQPNPP